MRSRVKQSTKAVLAILAGALLTTGGVSWVEADPQAGWHHDHTVYAFTNSEANGKCSYSCSQAGHSEYDATNTGPGTWLCECKD